MTEEHDNTVGGDQLHAEHTQGLTGQASSPVSQHVGEQANITTGGGDVAGHDIDKRQGAVFVEHSTIYGDVIGQQHNYYQPATTLLDRQQQRNRRAMLAKVKSIWIDGLLEHSLAKELRIALDLTEQPDAVDLPLNALVQELKHPPRPLPTGTPIIKVFEQMGGALLILGVPGAGKTILLLELARDLIARAEGDEGHPILVVFNLSSWAEKQRPLKEWLVEELNRVYDVPWKLAQAWMDADMLLPLLDGLDEVTMEHRDACVAAINTYRVEHGLVPLTVCSRVADYEALTIRLRLQGAIAVQPLTKQQVDVYLERAGEKLAGVRAAVRSNIELREMLDTPLMLSIVMLAYAEQLAAQVQATGKPDERRRQLFSAYTRAMFRRRGEETRYTEQQTTHWLNWLAQHLIIEQQTVFYLDRLQRSWLPPSQRWLIHYGPGLVFGLSSGLLVWLAFGLVFGLAPGLAFGLIVLLIVWLVSTSSTIKPVDTLSWSWRQAVKNWRSSLAGGLAVGLVYALVGGLRGGLVFGLVSGLVIELNNGVIVKVAEAIAVPGQMIRRARWYAIASGMTIGLVVGLVYGLVFSQGGGLRGGLVFGRANGLIVGLGSGLIVGLQNGGRTYLQHTLLRWLLVRNDSTPPNFVDFLNHSVERIFLRRVGGGYIFVHRLLMEHFASLADTPPEQTG